MRRRENPRTFALEVAIVLAVSLYYILGNQVFEAERGVAIENARDIIAFQQGAGLDWELGAQAFFGQFPTLMAAFVLFYAGPHFVLTFGFLLWAYWFRFESFHHVRNGIGWFTVTVFTFQWVFPVAPPRMVPELGLQDTVTQTLPVNAETGWINALVNDVAAVPSVHTGWSFLVALYVVRLTTNPHRWVWFAYPGLIMLSIIATANHFVWDLVTGIAWVGLSELTYQAWLYTRSARTAKARRLPPWLQPASEATQ